jgi:hypothetical protein
VQVHLRCLTLAHAIERATRGHRRGAGLTAMVSNHASPDRPPPIWRPRMAPPDALRCKGLRGLRRGGLRTSSVLLQPSGLGDLRALRPRLPPTCCPAHLPADHLHGGTGQGTRTRLLPAPLAGCRRRGRFSPCAVALLPDDVCSMSWHTSRVTGLARPLASGGFLACLDPCVLAPPWLWRLPVALGPMVSNALLAVRACTPVPRGSRRLATTPGSPVGGAPISTTAA